MHIPRIIHQTYKTRHLPERWKDTPATWQTLHPDWTYMFWTDKDNRELIERVDPTFLPLYDAYPYPIQRADAVRYYILKYYGGIYVDLDIQANQSFEPVFQQLEHKNKETGLFHSSNSFLSYSTLTNSIMIAIPQSLFFDNVIKVLKTRAQTSSFQFYSLLPHTTIMNTTGPSLVNDTFMALTPQIRRKQHVFLHFLYNCNVCSIHKHNCITKNNFLTIIVGDSWHNIDSTLINIFYCHSSTMVFVTLCILLIVCMVGKHCTKS
ncbi:MAG TPA: hypothetical protein EYO58_05245 [Flavobacteriales bacterium]|nr:hypothetical protein [Flavobacteriales bacterium]